jgi:hypothetical protein
MKTERPARVKSGRTQTEYAFRVIDSSVICREDLMTRFAVGADHWSVSTLDFLA